ncbi:hypothetical protein HJC23_012569 [Cyclotella cryptica]|uniref:Myb-like domain-containing protein n=1 Tax=Cyclotella cryptica TaxID=29204 RepID=A0ABD3NXR8_9STRA|eukprot:CCRYP_019032-RA/>CCRYP_019032-RA protein AED:0.00 eAED:0.00 QI:87/-1/1/1/-1/1/1/72/539
MESDAQNAAKAEKPLGATASAIRTALESNLVLQTELKRRLVEVRRLLAQNRLRAAKVTESLSLHWALQPYHQISEAKRSKVDETDNADEENEGAPNEASANLGKEYLRKSGAGMGNTPKTPNIGEIKPSLDFNPTRRWTRRFFVDEYGSTPDIVNQDVVLEEKDPHSIANNDTNNDVAKLQYAWTKSDIATLQRAVDENLKKAESNCSTSEIEVENGHGSMAAHLADERFFEEVASSLNFTHPRTAEDCRLAYLTFADPNIVTTKFSKQESLFLLSTVRELAGDDKGNVNWHELTAMLNSKFYSSDSRRRTPWQCFKHFRSNLQKDSARCPPWTAEEDELLLKYIAAHGPQFVFGGDAVAQACQNLFPLRDPKQVYQRAHSSLVNPNYVQDRWDINEERKLALLMRAYSDQPNPIRHASSTDHFPHRAQIRVASKWNRSLDPTVSRIPFTATEDNKLLAAVNEVGSGQMASIVKMFPNRSCGQLWTRWTELAEENDIASKLQSRLIEQSFGRKRGLLGTEGDGLMRTDDFVLQKKKRKA